MDTDDGKTWNIKKLANAILKFGGLNEETKLKHYYRYALMVRS